MVGCCGKISNKKGFTLIELIVVLIILGVVLGIGIPKYVAVQKKAEYDADVTTIKNIAKAAEVYAAQTNKVGEISLNDLIIKEIVDGTQVLQSCGKKLDHTDYTTGANPVKFTIDENSLLVTNLAGSGGVIQKMIGASPY